jgi:hypothetical protein
VKERWNGRKKGGRKEGKRKNEGMKDRNTNKLRYK